MRLKYNPVSLLFIILCTVGFFFSGLSLSFLINEIIVRFMRNGIFVLALIIPITAGLGLNFSIIVGSLCAQVALILAVNYQIVSYTAILYIILITFPLALLCGFLIGSFLVRVKGREMIASIIIGFFFAGLYQLFFMGIFGKLIIPSNPDLLLTHGTGIRNMIDLKFFRNTLDELWLFSIGSINIPLFMILVIFFFAALIYLIQKSSFGKACRAVNENAEQAMLAGINPKKIKVIAIMISIVLASFGQIIYMQNIGMLNIYTAHLNSDIFASAAILAGGATIYQAKIRHALLGLILFHALFIISPHVGQNIFTNPALGEYFRSAIAYGTIAIALILNVHKKALDK